MLFDFLMATHCDLLLAYKKWFVNFLSLINL